MAEALQQRFELLLYGKDDVHPSGTAAVIPTTADEPRSPSSIVDPESPSTIALDEKTGAKTSTGSVTPTEENIGAELDRTATWRTVSSFIHPKQPDDVKRWEPTPFHIRPLSGILALAIAVCCILSSLAILIVSNGQPVKSWPVSPTVYLAIVTAVANSCFALALAQARPVSWWYRASRGASIKALESHWHTINTLAGAFFYGKVSLLTAACIVTAFAIIDGPLLQRASSVQLATTVNDITLNLQLLPELQTGFSANYWDHEIWWNWNAYEVLRNWTYNKPIPYTVPDCESSCKATIQAPGVARMNCNSKTWPITPAMTRNFNATWGGWTSVAPDGAGDPNLLVRNNPAFYVNLMPGEHNYPPGADREGAYLQVGLANWDHYNGSYVETSCWLYSAIVEYDVTMENNAISLDNSPNQGRLVRLANNTSPADILKVNQTQVTTLDGISQWLSMFVNANATVAMAGLPGQTFSEDYTTFNPFVAQHMDLYAIRADQLAFLDPTDEIVLKYNQIMFRAGIANSTIPNVLEKGIFDKDISLNQTVQAKQTIKQDIFESDLRWFAGAAAIELITILLILPMFWGWWTLGWTNHTMSPFTMALAFNAPLLEDVNSAAGARGVVRQLGSMQVKFGLVGEPGTHDDAAFGVATGRLGIAEGSNVVRPQKGVNIVN